MSSGKRHKVLERLGQAEPSTFEDVRAILEDIRVAKGYMEDQYRLDLDNLSPDNRDTTLSLFAKKRRLEAAFTKSVSEQLYSSKYRFLYELVQNADDSLYSKACRASTLPFLRFIITPTTFVVETNEDGFKRTNVEAVCATGESSKKASATDDQIGEKGFGFKSVFSVADEVHIQSGLWSFRFEHRQGEDGLGMVTPLDADAVFLPTDVTTRITLRLAKTTIQNYQDLLNAVASMPETTIFFLQKLQHFQIHVTDLDGRVSTTRFEKADLGTSMSRVQLRRYQKSGDKTAVEESLYRCFTHIIKHMPENEYRKGRKSARVDLAFPVEPASKKPKLCKHGQHVFAYLPLQRIQQIQFLIQSDFVTSANRESIIDCSWNTAIFQGIAKTFALAVECFAKDNDPLRYSWLEYLPTELSDDRWKTLCPLIVEELASRSILQTWRRRFKEPGNLLLLREHMLYEGKPILDDLPDDVYLAPEYKPYKTMVKSLGVRYADLTSMIIRLEADIMKPNSTLKTTDPCDSWHTAFASMFLGAWAPKSPDVPVQVRLKRLAIIPLQNRQQWAGAASKNNSDELKIYFSNIDGVMIPDSIGLRLLDTHASSNPTRKDFYAALGVKECSYELVLDKIWKLHSQNTHPNGVSSHLRYLFYANEDPKMIQPWIRVPTTVGTHVTASRNLYLPSTGKDDLHQLVSDEHSRFQDTVKFLDKSLMELETGCSNVDGFEWQEWLQKATGARYHPPLLDDNTNKSSFKLSPALVLVHKSNPKKFLRALRAHWDDYEKDAHNIKADLGAMQVPCLDNANGSSRRGALKRTYLPTASVIGKVLELALAPSEIHILWLPGRRGTADELDRADHRKWKFLKELGVRDEPDLDFYKQALEAIVCADQEPDFDVLVEIYTGIALEAKASDHDSLCEYFSMDLLWIPDRDLWMNRGYCNWRGPSFLRNYGLLEPHYGDSPKLSRFFEKTLDVNDTSIDNVLDELMLRTEDDELTSIADARDIYDYLWTNVSGEEAWERVVEFFQDGYILGTNNKWYKASDCVWQAPFVLSGCHDVSTTYPHLEEFFVGKLGIKKVTPGMLIGEINKMVNKKTPKYDEVRKRLIEVGMVLAKSDLDKEAKHALQSLSKTKFLPQRHADGSSALLGISAKFVIADHPRYRSAFSKDGMIDILLDFTVEEVQIMNVMFEHLDIQKYYLSFLVAEKSDIEGEVEEDGSLSERLQDKAYALYCCAAKYKSVKALPGDQTLFNILSRARVFKGDLATHLVIEDKDLGLDLRVQSDRIFLHHDLAEGYLKLYVPEGRKQRQVSYRSQLPMLLADIMDIDRGACHDISVIIGNDLRALDDILVELDISSVSWIEKPFLDLSDDEGNEDGTTSSLGSPRASNAAYTGGRRRPSSVSPTRSLSPSESTLIDYVTATSRLAASHPSVSRSSDQASRDRRIGALGELFFFEKLRDLNLNDFTLDNWRSTIRGEINDIPGYRHITNWKGRETADIVYEDCDSELTEWLDYNCTGSFPAYDYERDFAEQPIEYYFEVKSTTGACGSRFFLSAGQYKRMHDMAVRTDEEPTRVYVIVRVFNVESEDVGWEVFVDPVRLMGTHIKFEAEGWIGKTL